MNNPKYTTKEKNYPNDDIVEQWKDEVYQEIKTKQGQIAKYLHDQTQQILKNQPSTAQQFN